VQTNSIHERKIQMRRAFRYGDLIDIIVLDTHAERITWKVQHTHHSLTHSFIIFLLIFF
jgi:hypothetical protein